MLTSTFVTHLLRQQLSTAAPLWFRALSTNKAQELSLIRQLREKSGAPLGEVRQCLAENGWDVEQAYDALRKKGLAAAAKKSSRHAADGLVAVATAPGMAAVVEINSETDFVARMDSFQTLVREVAAAALRLDSSVVDPMTHEVQLEALAETSTSSGSSVTEACTQLAAEVRENVRLRRAFRISSDGLISTYLHNSTGVNTGRIAGLVALEGTSALDPQASERVSALGSELAMHAVGMRAQYLSRTQVPEAVLNRERQVLREQALASGKKAEVVEKMIEGRLNKFYEEFCLLDQKFLLQPEVKVSNVLKQVSKELNTTLKVTGFVRVQVGEGLQKADDKDFASQVSEMVQGN